MTFVIIETQHVTITLYIFACYNPYEISLDIAINIAHTNLLILNEVS